MEQKEVSVIIPHYVRNPFKDLVNCLDSIEKILNVVQHEVVVVLNGGVPTFDINRVRYAGVRFICIDRKITSYEARNIGVLNSVGSIIAFIDSDVTVGCNFFNELHKQFEDADVMLSGGCVVFSEESKTSFITANLAVRRSVFKYISFDGARYSGGDIAFADMAIKGGFRAELSMNRIVLHKPENYLVRLHKSLRYGSGSTTNKVASGWLSICKSIGLHTMKTLGFLWFKLFNKPIGKL